MHGVSDGDVCLGWWCVSRMAMCVSDGDVSRMGMWGCVSDGDVSRMAVCVLDGEMCVLDGEMCVSDGDVSRMAVCEPVVTR